ncbi:MAG: hypothetical protein KDB87_14040 [Flavobacteriales bacterium]|nr:hypothetical protein [Flavobacteriales bacterium]MCB0814264.1 hypothetical protein [Flavobacteriales bacterium]
MKTPTMIRSTLTLFTLTMGLVLAAQDYGFSTSWTHDLKPVRDSLQVDTVTLPAQLIVVHEADDGEVYDLWKLHLKERAASVDRGGDDLLAGQAKLDELGPVELRGRTNWDKKRVATDVRLVVVDTQGAPVAADRAGTLAHDLAVALNKAVVNAQIAEVQKDLDKVNDDLEKARKEHGKAVDNEDDLQGDLQKLQDKAEDNLKDAEKVRKEIASMQRKYDLNKDPKTLEKIAKKQKELAKLESRQIDLMEDQQKTSKKIDKAGDDAPDALEDIGDLQAKKEAIDAVMESLKVKLASIR